MMRNFKPMVESVERWQQSQLSDVSAKMIIYRAFVEAELEAPRHLDRKVHDLYFAPQFDEFRPRTMWSLSNAFTSAFKELEPIPAYRATAKLAGLLAGTESPVPARPARGDFGGYSAHWKKPSNHRPPSLRAMSSATGEISTRRTGAKTKRRSISDKPCRLLRRARAILHTLRPCDLMRPEFGIG